MSDAAPARRVIPPVFFLAALLLLALLHRYLPGLQLVGAPLRFLGLPLVAAGLALVLWAAGLFRRAGTTIKPFDPSSALVVSGPYRRTRNPMYLGMTTVLLGTALLLGSLLPFLVVPAFVAVIDRRFVRAEEARLEQTFGAAYTAYQARVRRWI